jgi:hypothetical protein
MGYFLSTFILVWVDTGDRVGGSGVVECGSNDLAVD